MALRLSGGLFLLFFIVRFPVTATFKEHSIRHDSPHHYVAVVLAACLVAAAFSVTTIVWL